MATPLNNAANMGYLASAAGMANPAFAAAQFGLGLVQSGVSLYRLNELRKQRMAQFSDNIDPLKQNVSMFQERMEQGVPQSYLDLATNTAQSQQAARYRNIADSSSGMGSYLARAASVDTANLGLRLAQMSDQERRTAMGQLESARRSLVSQMNMDTQARRQYRLMQEQALGGALRAGTGNMAQAIDYGMPALGKMFRGSGGYSGSNSGGSQPAMDYPVSTLDPYNQQGMAPIFEGMEQGRNVPYGYDASVDPNKMPGLTQGADGFYGSRKGMVKGADGFYGMQPGSYNFK
jgi:hypothetical protein